MRDPAATLIDWGATPLSGGATGEIGLTGGLWRVSGEVESLGHAVPWSAVLKILTHSEVVVGDYRADRDDPRGFDYWRREADAYASGLLGDLGEGLLAPRCWRVDEHDGEVAIWLEELPPDVSTWSVERYRLAAAHLGLFNGAYLDGRKMPSRPWLSRGRIHDWLRGRERGIRGMRTDRRPGLLASWLSDSSVSRVERLWQRKAALLTALTRLPTTLCHHDAHRRNLVAVPWDHGDQTVAIDWAAMGVGQLGEEMATFVGVTLQFLDVSMDEADDFEDASLEGYLSGLRAAGWTGDEAVLRFGYQAALGLSMGVGAAGTWFAGLVDPATEQLAERIIGHPADEIAAQWAAMQPYLLDRGEKALEMLDAGLGLPKDG